jgi:MSHA biogenesis protein MshJ
MSAPWQTLTDAVTGRYRPLAPRERALLAVALVAVTWLGWLTMISDPLTAERQQRAAAAAAVAGQLQAAAEAHQRLQEAAAADPDDRLLRERASLERELSSMGEAVGTVVDRFVEPERMAALLEALMTARTGLAMVRAENLTIESLGDADGAAPTLYRHPLRLVFRGSYFDVVDYLQTVERSPWALGWRSLDYRVVGYPLAEVTLELETLSRDARWIGL